MSLSKFNTMIAKHARQRDRLRAAAKMFLAVLNDEATVVPANRQLEVESAKALLANEVGAVRSGVS